MHTTEIESTSIAELDHGRGTVLMHGGLPYLIEALLALFGMIITAPIMGFCAIAIALESRGPVIFRQQRMGRGGREFVLYKFRSMVSGNSGPEVTATRDNRITPFGAILRKTKLDELPELWNVVHGDMSLVGPRPEVPRYVKLDDSQWRQVLQVKPGITHPVTILLRNEEDLIASAQGDSERFYLDYLLPNKLRGYLDYERERNWRSDLKVIARTFLVVLHPRSVQNDEIIRSRKI